MRRKPTILIVLIFLLIGGGAMAFYLHLRKQDPPPLSEVEAFLRQFPLPPDQRGPKSEESAVTFHRGPLWLRKIGFRSSIKKVPFTHYRVLIPPSEHPAELHVVHDSGKILAVWTSADPKDHESFKRILLEKFPNLRRCIKTTPFH